LSFYLHLLPHIAGQLTSQPNFGSGLKIPHGILFKTESVLSMIAKLPTCHLPKVIIYRNSKQLFVYVSLDSGINPNIDMFHGPHTKAEESLEHVQWERSVEIKFIARNALICPENAPILVRQALQ
tara:strand:+ start:469 stop:843 length:375 start_codon:yes stop_codon:yes gene_type:complete